MLKQLDCMQPNYQLKLYNIYTKNKRDSNTTKSKNQTTISINPTPPIRTQMSGMLTDG